MKWDSSWWPRPPSRWFIVCIAVLINLVVLALLYRIGVYVDGCCESAWFERFWNGAFATMTGTLTLGAWLIKHAFSRPAQPRETAGLPDPRQLADDYLADDERPPERTHRRRPMKPASPLTAAAIRRLVVLSLVLAGVSSWYGFDLYARYDANGLGIYLGVLGVLGTFLGVVISVLSSQSGGGADEASATTRDPLPDPRQLADDYLADQHRAAQQVRIHDLFDTHCRLPGDRTQVPLASIYVPLYVVEESAERVNDPDFRRLSFLRAAEGAIPVARALAEGIAKAPEGLRFVLIGEAGSGKSSVVGDLIEQCRPGATPPEDWPEALRRRQVLRFDLKLLGAGVQAAGKGATAPFWRALGEDLFLRRSAATLDASRDRDWPAVVKAVELLRTELGRHGLLLLDGLDEVEDPVRRLQVRDLVADLGRALGPGCALVVTARPYVYPDAALNGFVVWRLQPLTVGPPGVSSQAADLVDKWHRALRVDEGLGRALIAALAADPARAELATRPLLLTLLIALGLARRGQGEPLPTDRTGLMEAATALFVKRWHERNEGVIEGVITGAFSRELRAALTPERLREVLQTVSLKATPDRGKAAAAPDGRPEVTVSADEFYGKLCRVLPEQLHSPAAELQILNGAGLLFPRGAGSYGYVHRLFQEYLAACALVASQASQPGHAPHSPLEDLAEELATRLRADPASWREVTRFAAVRLARPPGASGTVAGPAIALVRTLLEASQAPTPDDRDYQVALAAGLALADLRAALSDTGLTRTERGDLADAKHRLDAWLLRLVEQPAPSPQTRRDFGRLIGRLGDPRPGIIPAGWTPDETPAEPRSFPLDLGQDFDWVEIPAGDFTPGSDPGDALAYADEQGGQAVALPAFAITRYPITCAQFAAFTRGGGYGEGATPPDWWQKVSPEAVAWWHGGNPGLDQLLADPDFSDENKSAYEAWVKRRDREARRRPWFQGDPAYADWLLPNHPVIGVSWFEAMAFCRWLTAQPQAREGGWEFRLPQEIQWERAARGLERRRWPWGDDWRDDAANSGAARLGGTTAVGLFPAQSPEGLRDLAGNVWEWTATRWGPRAGTAAYGWPLVPDDRDDPEGADLRIMRGGSWYGEPEDAPRLCRGASRYRNYPYNWNIFQGLRVVRVSLAHSVS